MENGGPDRVPTGTPRWRWWVTFLALILQSLAGAIYFAGLATWALTDGGGFLGTSESVGKTTLPTVLLLMGGIVATFATAFVGLSRTRSWVASGIGIAGASIVGMATSWMLAADYTGQGLAAAIFSFSLPFVWLAAVATVLGFVLSLLLGKRKPQI